MRRLAGEGVTRRKIGAQTGLSQGTINRILQQTSVEAVVRDNERFSDPSSFGD